ncbi:MAG TPA: methyltransferase domain-containing protein [Blastocatellia bacterium]|jgi:trans-aconitate 2-methyltransferase
MEKDSWNPKQYERFRDERSKPFFDLVELVRPQPRMRVVDLGCGTGDLTLLLHKKLGAGETVGLDDSEAMLAKAKTFVGDGLRFDKQSIDNFEADHYYDLVFSNAALHWVLNHGDLLARLTRALTARGQIAIQIPANHDFPTHTVAAQLAGEAPFRAALNGYTHPTSVLKPEEYATLLNRLGYGEQHVRLQVYGHNLASREDVVEWVKGSLLTAYERRLPTELYEEFIRRFRERLMSCLEDMRPYFLTYKRILLWAKL